MAQRQEWSFGSHTAWFEHPDTLWMKFRGAPDVESARWSVGLYRELGTRSPFYLLADITDSRHTPEARKYLVENTRTEWFLGIGYIGASYEQQAVTTGFMLALMRSGNSPYTAQYFDSVAQAIAWVEKDRIRRMLGR